MSSTELGTATYSTAGLAGFETSGNLTRAAALTAYDTLNDKVWVYVTGATQGGVQGTYFHKFTPILGTITNVESSIDVLGTVGLPITQPGTSAAHVGAIFVDRFNSNLWLSQYISLSGVNIALARINNVTGTLIRLFTVEELGLIPNTNGIPFITRVDQFSNGMLLLETRLEGHSFASYYKCNPITGVTTLLFHAETTFNISVTHNDLLYSISGGIVNLLDLTGTLINSSSSTAINFAQESVQFKELLGSTPGFNVAVEKATLSFSSFPPVGNISQRFAEFDFNLWGGVFDYTDLPMGYFITGGKYPFEIVGVPDYLTFNPRKSYIFTSQGQNFDKPLTPLTLN